LALDGRLDLHGLTLREAELALRGFVARGAAQGHVWLLVITGKGARGEGKLRTALPNWLAEPEMRAYVAAFSQAGAAHGGGGAFYVRLRKSRLSV
jgi:DNA-nicking Smr family endonuclease